MPTTRLVDTAQEERYHLQIRDVDCRSGSVEEHLETWLLALLGSKKEVHIGKIRNVSEHVVLIRLVDEESMSVRKHIAQQLFDEICQPNSAKFNNRCTRRGIMGILPLNKRLDRLFRASIATSISRYEDDFFNNRMIWTEVPSNVPPWYFAMCFSQLTSIPICNFKPKLQAFDEDNVNTAAVMLRRLRRYIEDMGEEVENDINEVSTELGGAISKLYKITKSVAYNGKRPSRVLACCQTSDGAASHGIDEVDEWLRQVNENSCKAGTAIMQCAMTDSEILGDYLDLCQGEKSGPLIKAIASAGLGAGIAMCGTSSVAVPLAQLTLSQCLTVLTTGVLPTMTVVSNPVLILAGVLASVWMYFSDAGPGEGDDEATAAEALHRATVFLGVIRAAFTEVSEIRAWIKGGMGKRYLQAESKARWEEFTRKKRQYDSALPLNALAYIRYSLRKTLKQLKAIHGGRPTLTSKGSKRRRTKQRRKGKR